MQLAKIFGFLSIFLLSLPVLAKEVVCDHPQICQMAKMFLDKEDQKKIKFIQGVKITGDPHSFSPTPREIKTLLSANHLLLAPSDLQSWNKLVEMKRKKKKTFKVQLPSIQGNDISKGAWAHFWLNPFVFCQVGRDLSHQLGKWFSLKSNPQCPLEKWISPFLNQEKKYGTTLFVLGHDALRPTMQYLKFNFFELMGSHHSASISPITLKTLMGVQKNFKKKVYIEETNHPTPEGLEKTIKNWKRIKFDPMGSFPGEAPLKIFFLKLMAK